jgi:lipopolysaccharide/colanic/teichoic acid biosynthesis glycosyltransferase
MVNTATTFRPKAYDAVKRVLDIVGAIVLLTLLCPLMLIIVVAIRLDSRGKALFFQERLGRNGKPFKIWKFRTMITGAQQQGTGIFTHAGDARITRVGKLIRATSLDELPQLFNVVAGQMSFVGPRPPLTNWPHQYEDYDPQGKSRFKVRPGITGWSQVQSRNSAEWPERLIEDAHYVDNRSLMMDLRILLLTVGRVTKRDSVYREPESKETNE